MLTEHVVGVCDRQNYPSEISSHVASILDEGDIPLVSVTIEGIPNITRTSVQGGQSTRDFVALSHVRSQNLCFEGDSKCSLQQLQSMVNDLPESKALLELGLTLPWWIDAICFPQDHRKMTAKKNIKRVFEAAVAVLVLESSLRRQKPGSGSDYITAIRCSPWMKRLWTLQEAALAKRLYFSFYRATVLLDDVNESEWKSKHRDAAEREHRTGKPDELREKLRCLDHFDEDIKSLFAATKKDSRTWSRDLDKEDKPVSASAAYPSEARKSHLKSILRLGYLSLPIFSLIRDIDEDFQSQAVIERILALYETESTTDQEMKPRMSTEMRLGVLGAFHIDRH